MPTIASTIYVDGGRIFVAAALSTHWYRACHDNGALAAALRAINQHVEAAQLPPDATPPPALDQHQQLREVEAGAPRSPRWRAD